MCAYKCSIQTERRLTSDRLEGCFFFSRDIDFKALFKLGGDRLVMICVSVRSNKM